MRQWRQQLAGGMRGGSVSTGKHTAVVGKSEILGLRKSSERQVGFHRKAHGSGLINLSFLGSGNQARGRSVSTGKHAAVVDKVDFHRKARGSG